MNYYAITQLTVLFCAHYFGVPTFSCTALKLDEGDPCKDPAVACDEVGAGFLVYNPKDCNQGYACIKDYSGNVVPSDNPFTCPDGLTFDYENQNCSSKTTSCDKACVNKGCYFECTSNNDGYVAYPNNCTVYFFCYQGLISAPSSCPDSTPYFNGSGCTDKEYLCCDACTVYCTSDDTGKNIADPYDCTAFYTCGGDQGIPGESSHSYCEEGEYFEGDTGTCTISTEQCEQICI